MDGACVRLDLYIRFFETATGITESNVQYSTLHFGFIYNVGRGNKFLVMIIWPDQMVVKIVRRRWCTVFKYNVFLFTLWTD